MRGSRSFGAASLTDVCLDKAVIQFAFSKTFQHLHAVFQTVYKHLVVTIRFFLGDDRLDDAPADRVETVDLRIRIAHGLILAGVQVDPGFLKPVGKLFKGKDGVDCSLHALIPDCFQLLCDAGT